jgi:hypothetical protein
VIAWRNADPPEANGPERGARTPIRIGPGVLFSARDGREESRMTRIATGRKKARRRIGNDLPPKGYHKGRARKNGTGRKKGRKRPPEFLPAADWLVARRQTVA